MSVQMCVPARTPRWVSPRRLLEEKLSELSRHADLRHAQQVHAQAVRADLHRDPYVAPKLIAAFSQCRHMALAVKVFDQIPEPNAHLYNTLIRAHVQNSQPKRAFEVFLGMLWAGVFPDNFSYSFVLKACYGKAWLPVIHMLHSHIEKRGFSADIYVPNSLIDSYCKSGSVGLISARKLLAAMTLPDVVSWNTMIGGFVRFGEVEEARKLFDEMPHRDMFTWNTMLDGYAKSADKNAMNEAFEFFQRMPERNVVSWSTLVLGYAKCGDIDMARVVFDKMPHKNSIAWTIMVSAYAKKALFTEACELYDQMMTRTAKLEAGPVISILSACSESGLLGLGQRVHASIRERKKKPSTLVSNALIDMYSKCGSLEQAERVFEETTDKNSVTWNAMIHGLAVHGLGDRALRLFSRMKDQGFSPDSITFVSVLCACTHAGYVKEGLYHFEAMERDYGIAPRVAHYGCLIDLLGRGGRLEEALGVVNTMPFEPNAVIWGTLLGACRAHNRLDLAAEVLERLVKSEPLDPGGLSIVSNICAAAGDWDVVARLRLRMTSAGEDQFLGFDKSAHEIYDVVGKLSTGLKRIGYVPIPH